MILLKLTGILKDEFLPLRREDQEFEWFWNVLTATFKDSRGDVVQDIIGCYNSKQKVWKQLLCVGDKILFKTSVAEPEDEMN